MRYFLAILFFVAVTFAQEMDTTLIVNEHGQLVGYIHEKGTPITISAPVPVVNQAPVAVQVPMAHQTQPQVSAPMEPVEDSREKYLIGMRDLYNSRGAQLSSRGTGLVIGGSLGIAVGLTMILIAIDDIEDDDDYYDDYDDNDEDGDILLALSGYGLALAGGVVLTSGIITKIVGSCKKRKGAYFDRMLGDYRYQKKMANISFAPTYNPKTGALGGNLALSF